MNSCQHTSTVPVKADTRTSRNGILISYQCRNCRRKWRVYYTFSDDSMTEIVSSGEIRKNRLIRERRQLR
jgi:hypothetical protein